MCSSVKCVQRTGLHVESVQTIHDLEPYTDAWNQLALEAPQGLPMLSHAWVASYLEHRLKTGETWLCLFAHDDEELVGVLPLVVKPFNLLGIRRLFLHTPNDWHTISVDFLMANGRQSEVIPLLLSALDTVLPTWYSLKLKRIPESSPTPAVFRDGFKGVHTIEEFDGMGSILKTDGSFEEYQAGLNSRFKRKLRRAEKNLAKLPDVQTLFLTNKNEMVLTFGLFAELEASGWKGKAGTAIKMSTSLEAFYAALVGRLSDLGWLEWHLLKTQEKAIGGQLIVRMGHSFVVFKTAYDESYAACSPGNILRNRTIARAFSLRDVTEINYLSDMPWHRYWRMGQISYSNLFIYRRRALSLIFGVLPRKVLFALRRLPGLRPAYGYLCDLFKRQRS